MRNDRTITVDRTKALEQVKANRETHQAEYCRALKGYKTKLSRKLQQEITRLEKSNGDFYLELGELQFPPSHHLKEYDMYIDLLEWQSTIDIQLSIEEFNNIIRNNWNWTNNWSNTLYFLSDIDDLRPEGEK